MRTLILVALVLQLAITVEPQFQFGDIISYPPACMLGVTVKHFAVYVGNNQIFERLKDPSLKPTCIYSPLDMSDLPERSNYLDGYKDKNGKVYQKGTDAQIRARIKEMEKKCGLYGALHSNCEHLATYVRYGVKVSLQFDLPGQRVCINPKIDTKNMIKYVRDTTTCPANRQSASG